MHERKNNIAKLLDRIFRDHDGRIVIWQWPNLPLSVWLIITAINFWVRGEAHAAISLIGLVALAAWALLEIAGGDSIFRRFLGVGVIIGIVAMKLLISL